MQYSWYEIVGMSVLVGLIVFLVFRGLDLVLEWSLERLRARQDKRLTEVSITSVEASDGLRKLTDALREVAVKRPRSPRDGV